MGWRKFHAGLRVPTAQAPASVVTYCSKYLKLLAILPQDLARQSDHRKLWRAIDANG